MQRRMKKTKYELLQMGLKNLYTTVCEYDRLALFLIELTLLPILWEHVYLF